MNVLADMGHLKWVFQVTTVENHLVKRFTNAYVSDNVHVYISENMWTLDQIVALTVYSICDINSMT